MPCRSRTAKSVPSVERCQTNRASRCRIRLPSWVVETLRHVMRSGNGRVPQTDEVHSVCARNLQRSPLFECGHDELALLICSVLCLPGKTLSSAIHMLRRQRNEWKRTSKEVTGLGLKIRIGVSGWSFWLEVRLGGKEGNTERIWNGLRKHRIQEATSGKR